MGTYAREAAELLYEELKRDHSGELRTTRLEQTISAVIERCAQVIQDAHGECNDNELMRRIRALSSAPTTMKKGPA